MRVLLRIGAAIGLVLTIVPSLLVFLQVISWRMHADLMTAGMIIWFATASWYRKPSRAQKEKVSE